MARARTEDEIVGPGGLSAQLTKRLVERALEVELTDDLGYEPHRQPPGGTRNTRNGRAAKTPCNHVVHVLDGSAPLPQKGG